MLPVFFGWKPRHANDLVPQGLSFRRPSPDAAETIQHPVEKKDRRYRHEYLFHEFSVVYLPQ